MASHSTHINADLLAFVEAWLPPPPAGVLDVGCGGGAMTRHLANAGYRASGIDPAAPVGEEFARSRLEDFAADAPFDAAVALRSLHHMDDLDVAVDSLARALRPGARVVVYEWAVERMDDAAWRWLAAHGLHDHQHGTPPHVIPLETVMCGMSRRFRLLSEERGPFLARERGREDLNDVEQAAIATGELQAIGARLVYEAAEQQGPGPDAAG